jgi:hypothetical protein
MRYLFAISAILGSSMTARRYAKYKWESKKKN